MVARWRHFLLIFWKAWETTGYAGRETFKAQIKYHMDGTDITWQSRHWKEITDKLVAFEIIKPLDERKPATLLVKSETARRIISTAPFAPLPTKEPPKLVRVPKVTNET